MNENRLTQKIVTIFVATVIFFGFFMSNPFQLGQKLSEYLVQSPEDLEDDEALTLDDIGEDFVDTMWKSKDLIQLNGTMAKFLKMKGFYSEQGIYIVNDDYVVSRGKETSTDYEFDQMVKLKDFCDKNNIKLLYVNEPTKYTDDAIFSTDFGIDSYSNQNADKLLSRLEEAGIATLDLRDNLEEEKLSVYDMFYRTDHHWKTQTGLWATQHIAEAMNEYCGTKIDTSVYDISNFTLTEYDDCWLGEQGRKIGDSYIGLEDFTLIEPDFETSYYFYNSSNKKVSGTFEDFIDRTIIEEEEEGTKDVYESKSWIHVYSQKKCVNRKVKNGKVLVLGDSYEYFMIPFLSLGVHELDAVIMRSTKDTFDLEKYILDGEFDTIVVSYAQFMIGAHDNESSSNYKMFSFYPDEKKD